MSQSRICSERIVSSRPGTFQIPLICLGLVVMVCVIYGQTLQHGFFCLDDAQNIYNEPMVTNGISWSNILWAFTHGQIVRYSPIMTISDQLDCQFFGLWAGGHHLTNVLLYAFGSVICFFSLLSLTNSLWRSAFAASVLAVHPLHVEPVVWLSCRSELLCGAFFFLTLLAYAQYARKPSFCGYAMVMLWFLLGLLSKPMMVTLPLVLLLLDYWPLCRLSHLRDFPALVKEKTPLLIVSAASCLKAVFVQNLSGSNWRPCSLLVRFSNVPESICLYLKNSFFPFSLSFSYPLPCEGYPPWLIIASTMLLVLVTLVACLLIKEKPFIFVGWMWFLVMLAPVSGIFQINNETLENRYMYLPLTGIVIASTWSFNEVITRIRCRRLYLLLVSSLLLTVFSILSFLQTELWLDSLKVWKHSLSVMSRDAIAQNEVGELMLKKGKVDEAIDCFKNAKKISPSWERPVQNIAQAYMMKGQEKEAVFELQQALQLDPSDITVLNNLSYALATARDDTLRDGERAVELATQADRASGGKVPAILETLAAAQAEKGDFVEALETARRSMKLSEEAGDKEFCNALRREITLYEQGIPLRDTR